MSQSVASFCIIYDWAKKSLVPSVEMIRFFVTGTEATMHAIRIARAYTKKERIVKFEGHYHGTAILPLQVLNAQNITIKMNNASSSSGSNDNDTVSRSVIANLAKPGYGFKYDVSAQTIHLKIADTFN